MHFVPFSLVSVFIRNMETSKLTSTEEKFGMSLARQSLHEHIYRHVLQCSLLEFQPAQLSDAETDFGRYHHISVDETSFAMTAIDIATNSYS